ncbi:MAG: PH domain-containing protein [Helicobacteraceae bacterium]|nr:PH domain-containing protein [Helicobacteraceae bacterium]
MSYISKSLMKDEEVIYTATVSWVVYVPFIFLFILATASWVSLFIIAPYFYEISTPKEFSKLISTYPLSVIGAILFTPSAFKSLLNAYLYRISTELAVTTKRVIAKWGFIRRVTIELNHTKVESFHIDQGIMGRILNFGNVIINGTGGGKTPIKNIEDPMRFKTEAIEIFDRIHTNNKND